MGRKLALLWIAIAALAVAGIMPATATAGPQLFEGSSPVLIGDRIETVSNNVRFTNTFLGTVECDSWAYLAEVVKNNGPEVEAEGVIGETDGCVASEELLTITEPTLVSFQTNGEDKGTLTLHFVLDFAQIECPYEGKGAFTYTTDTDVLNIADIELNSPLEFCEPEEGHIAFEGDFTMSAVRSGIPVTIRSEPPPQIGPSPQMIEGGIPLAEGSKFIGASTNPLITNTGLGKVECASLSVSAEVLKNSEKEVKAKGTSGEAKTCKGTEGSEVLPLTITEPELLSLVTTGKDSGTLGLTFVVDLGPFSCHFEGEGSFSYATGTDVLNVAGVELKTNEICESGEGAPLFEGDFTMATANGSPVTIPAPSTPSPVLKESGVVLAEGESIRAKSTNAVTTRTALGRLECGELTFTTAVNRNSEGEISLQTTGATTKSCLAEGEPLTLTEPTLDLLSEGGDSADLTISFAADVGPFECPFEGEDTVAYTTSTDVLKITGIVLETPVEICEPLVGKPGFEGEFTLTTANGTQVKFS